MKNYKKRQNFTWFLPEKLCKYPILLYLPEKLTKFRILHDFLPENVRILHNNCPKKSSWIGGGARAPCPPSPTPMTPCNWPQSPSRLSGLPDTSDPRHVGPTHTSSIVWIALSYPAGIEGWVDPVFLVIYRDGLPVGRRSPIIITRSSVRRPYSIRVDGVQRVNHTPNRHPTNWKICETHLKKSTAWVLNVCMYTWQVDDQMPPKDYV